MLPIDYIADTLSHSIAVSAISILIVLFLACYLLVADWKCKLGTRSVVCPCGTKLFIGNTLEAIRIVPVRHD